jgi:hypothetical protein
VPATFFRIVRNDPPTRRDFLSNQARRGDPRPDLPPYLRRLWDGLSVHATEEASRRQAKENPYLGSFIAEVRIPDEHPASVRWERTIPRNAEHHTLWGEADTLLTWVVRVVPV